MWRVTIYKMYLEKIKSDFNPHPPCGGWPADLTPLNAFFIISIHTLRVEGDSSKRRVANKLNISIHTLRVEGDCLIFFYYGFQWQFQSTPSVWRVTTVICCSFATPRISIHTLRVEGDHKSWALDYGRNWFQSTPSVWRVTCYRTLWEQ